MKNIILFGLIVSVISFSVGHSTGSVTSHVNNIDPKNVGGRFTFGEVNMLIDTMRGLYNTDIDRATPTDNRIGIGAPPSSGERALKLDVEGPVGADKYCDEKGSNCLLIDAGGNYGLNTDPQGTLRLKVAGAVGGAQYCDSGGNNCRPGNKLYPYPTGCGGGSIIQSTGDGNWICGTETVRNKTVQLKKGEEPGPEASIP